MKVVQLNRYQIEPAHFAAWRAYLLANRRQMGTWELCEVIYQRGWGRSAFREAGVPAIGRSPEVDGHIRARAAEIGVDPARAEAIIADSDGHYALLPQWTIGEAFVPEPYRRAGCAFDFDVEGLGVEDAVRAPISKLNTPDVVAKDLGRLALSTSSALRSGDQTRADKRLALLAWLGWWHQRGFAWTVA